MTMKKTLALLAIIVTFLILQGCGGQQSPQESDREQAANDSPVSEEEVLFNPGDFEDPSVCGGCHGEIHQAWSGSMHAAAWTNELYQPDYLLAAQETDGATDVFCGECHAPVAVRVGQLPPVDGSEFDDTSRQGVSCDFCHTVSEVKEPVNVQSISEPGRLKRGPRGDTVSPAHDTVFSELHTDPAFCGACHNVRHPTSGTMVIDTYDDWLDGPYAEEGITCQNCHMTPTPGVGKNPGKSATIGDAQERDHVATHFFVGGSSWTLNRRGYEEHAQMAEENLRSAAELSLDGQVTANGLELTVTAENVGAGHAIPTGVTYIRKMWLELTVENEQGEVVYVSGHTDDDNHVDPDAVFYRKLFIDGDGNQTSKSWLAEGIGYDRRIPAGGSDSETYIIDAVGSSYTATVRLLYRTTTQEALNNHLSEEDLEIESVEMAKETIVIN
ncbi:multiheme c-type cytochrome [Dethiobacter alkaliphilus]|uniref:Cytochrome c-552/4 domain-containing protein n=1 Tax=Dethiobacter alkaliphilus AHT 1 TaxID=555088 RepID=C0GCW5_DETAL|nr:multiheme c-type cytochrome [Dethiobacter alkaliphilus]EEG79050.1 conserved hypothetical protein [Dethiobacter alkaliphilus AHT 1]